MSDLRTVIDQMGREVTFAFPPKRIVSLVPSQTEFLIDIGAPVIGRTKFCIHPEDKVRSIPIVGGTKNFRIDEIYHLNPDLIIGNKEENYKEGIHTLSKDFAVWMSDVNTLDDAYEMMTALGELCDCSHRAKVLIKECREAMNQVKNSKSGKVVYFIWKNPWMAAGKNTFIDYLLRHLGYENVVTHQRYPELTHEDISTHKPDTLLFSSEPYPFKKKDIIKATEEWPYVKCELVDGELFSWYGSRLKKWIS